MKVHRYIASLLLICFSAFLGHNLVPHHHHSTIASPLATDCPFEHGDQHGHEHDTDATADADEQPTHCHAFNDVVFEKYNTPVNKSGMSQVLAMEISGQLLVPKAPLALTSDLFIILKPPGGSLTDVGTRALRGPPAFA